MPSTIFTSFHTSITNSVGKYLDWLSGITTQQSQCHGFNSILNRFRKPPPTIPLTFWGPQKPKPWILLYLLEKRFWIYNVKIHKDLKKIWNVKHTLTEQIWSLIKEIAFTQNCNLFVKYHWVNESHKIIFKILWSFKIIIKISSLAYNLDLPRISKLYPVIHIFLLKPSKGLTPTQPPTLSVIKDHTSSWSNTR